MSFVPTTDSILNTFEACVEEINGCISGAIVDQELLFARALIPRYADAKENDRMQGGVAIRALNSQVSVHPFLYREVCRNGAIMAQSYVSAHFSASEFETEFEFSEHLRSSVKLCCSAETFDTSMQGVRDSVGSAVESAISILGMVKDLSPSVIRMILRRFERSGPTRFSLMNAVTSVARDQTDPEKKWNLEELGGAIGAFLLPVPKDDGCGLYIDADLHVSCR